MKNIVITIFCILVYNCSFGNKEVKQKVELTATVIQNIGEPIPSNTATAKENSNPENAISRKVEGNAKIEAKDSTKTGEFIIEPDPPKQKISFFEYLIIIIISFVCSFLTIIIYFRKLLHNRIIQTIIDSDRIRTYIKDLLVETQSAQNFNKNSQNKSLYTLTDKDIDDIVEKTLQKLKENISIISNDREATSSVPLIPIPKIAATETPPKRTKFFSVEPRDGQSFDGSGFSDVFRPTESVYIIDIQSDSLAYFSVIDDADTMGRAIKYKKELLDIACENLSSSIDAVSILTKKPGIAQKVGSRWVIKQKALIKFE